ncbi:hypothetical protein Mapa_012381 [Marchantia paleacea]|nr:hypothetical protein Mapa_012381 [Marchantia paleacea]
MGINRHDFLASGVILARLFHEVPRLLEQGTLKLGENKNLVSFDGFLQVPDVASLRFSDIPASVQAMMEMVMVFSQTASRPLVVNSFYDLESRVIDGLAAFRKVIPVGPIDTEKDNVNDESRKESRSELLHWLDTQPEASVIYICLGSIVCLHPPQIKQLALALESNNNCRFLWALHQRDINFKSLADVLPPDFQTKVKGRGLVTSSWVPQVQILKHPAPAGFLSHCGWSSTVESVSSGVLMIAWPHMAEQHLNCRYLVDGIKVAIEVLIGPEHVVEQNEFQRVFALLLGKDFREKCKLLKAQAAAAVASGGSSHNAFSELVQDIKLMNE